MHSGKFASVLHVDDDKEFLELTQQFMRKIGPELRFTGSTSVEDALKQISTDTFDMIVSDYQMPKDNGLQLLEHIRETGNTIPFIMFTGKGREEVAMATINLGGNYYLKKGGDQESQYVELHNLIRRAILHKRAEKALRRREAQYASILRAAPIGIGVVKEREITWVSDTLCDMVGYEKHELVGKNARVLYPTEEEYLRVGRVKYRRMHKSGTGVIETNWLTNGGELLDIHLSSSPIDIDDESAGVTFTAMDVTHRRNFLEKKNQEIEEFLNFMMHDIRGNYHKIASYAELIDEEYDDPHAKKIMEITHRTSNLLEQASALVDVGFVTLDKEPIDLKNLVSKLAASELPDDVEFRINELPNVIADRAKLEQLFANLFRNAIEHGKPKTIEVMATSSKIPAEIRIMNDGEEIPAENKSEVFSRGFSTREEKGGLGLSIVRRAAEVHGWEVELLDKKKTTFSILIPDE